jgi:hypothetical protein
MKTSEFKQLVRESKVSKYKKIKALQDAVHNLLAAPEGCSELLKDALDVVLKVTPEEHVFQDGNNWEVKTAVKAVS